MNNKDTVLNFIRPGLFTSIQDGGRPGYCAFGVPTGGVLDRKAARIANLLVGNPEDEPVLEITIVGPTIEFKQDCQIGLAGANISPKLNGQPINMYETISCKIGSVLSFGKLMSGCRCYMAVGGCWKVNTWLGSACPLLYVESLPISQNIIRKNTTIDIEIPISIPPRKTGSPRVDTSPKLIPLNILPGPEFDTLSKKFLKSFLRLKFTLSKDFNRMGCRLLESVPYVTNTKELLSSGIVPGTIQLTHAGQLVILLADAQTTGGYPRIAKIIDSDLDHIAQLKPEDKIQFHLITLDEAKQINEYRNREWKLWKNMFLSNQPSELE